MTNNTQLSDKAIEIIKAHIDETLRVRCINTTTVLMQGLDKRGKAKLNFVSTPFNTVPVIHSPITLCDFGSSVTTSGDVITFWLNIQASYEGNGVDLFNVSGHVQGDYLFINGGHGILIA